MRRVIYALTASLDGCISRRDGSIDWIVMDPNADFASFYKSFDAAIIGRKSYDKMVEFTGPKRAFYPGMKNYVVSRSQPPGARDGAEFVSGDLKTGSSACAKTGTAKKTSGSRAAANSRAAFSNCALSMR